MNWVQKMTSYADELEQLKKDRAKQESSEVTQGMGAMANTANMALHHKKNTTPTTEQIRQAWANRTAQKPPTGFNAGPTMPKTTAAFRSATNAVKHPIQTTVNTAKGLGRGIAATSGGLARATPYLSAVGAIFDYYDNTKNDVYDERFGGYFRPEDDDWEATKMGKFALQQGLGFASDVGNVLFGGLPKKFLYRDGINEQERLNQKISDLETKAQAEQSQDKRIYAQTGEQKPPIQIGGIGNNVSLPDTPQQRQYSPTQLQGGITNTNPDYQALLKQVQTMQEDIVAPSQNALGAITHTPRRDWENEAQRKALLQQATTPIKGARGLTANQMRLAHDLSNDDIKLAQERHLQQNQLNHQLLQEQMQQQGQNARTLVGEQGQMARAIMNEQGQNNRFGANFGLDVAKFNEDNKNTQYELGLKGADLRARLGSQALDDSVKQGHLELFNQFVNAKDDGERDKILTQMAVLQGRGGGSSGGNDGGRYDTMTDADGNQVLYHTKTGEIKSDKQPASQEQLAQAKADLQKAGNFEEKRKIVLAMGYPPDDVDAVIKQLQG